MKKFGLSLVLLLVLGQCTISVLDLRRQPPRQQTQQPQQQLPPPPVTNAAAPDPAAWLKLNDCSMARNNLRVLEEAQKSGGQVYDETIGGIHTKLLGKQEVEEALAKSKKFLAEECGGK